MRMKFTQTQKELLAMLPQDLQNSKELTDSAKLVLGNIFFLYGMEYAQNNGFVYRTNLKMMEETGIKSEHTLIFAIKKLESLGFIETKRGKRKEASTYKLIKNCSNNLEKCSNNCSETQQNCSNNCSKIETLQNQLLLLQKEIVLLQKEIENIKKCSNNFKNCSTESDTDIETDIDKEKYNNKSILEHKDLVRIVTEENKKEKNNKKEKVNEMKNGVLNEMKLEDKATSTQVHPSSIIDYRMSGVSDKNIYIPKNTVISSILPSKDDMDIDAYTSMNLEKRGLSSSVKANKATGGVENTSMDNLFTSVEKTQPDAKEVAKTQNKAYSLQEWMTEYKKLLLQVENTDVEDYSFISILDAGVNLFESFPKNEGSYQRAMQDLRYWVAKKLDFKKSLKISEHWNQYYRNI